MKKILMTLILLLALPFAVMSAEIPVPAPLQVALFYKIFSFEESTLEKNGEEIVVGIFYDPAIAYSIQAKEDIKANFIKLSDRKINDKKVTIKEITSIDQLTAIDIIYVMPGNGPAIKNIVKKCQVNKIISISGVEEYAQEGLAITIGLKNKKPKIIINKIAMDLSGAKFCSKVLALAQII